jgi:hypothetical protein
MGNGLMGTGLGRRQKRILAEMRWQDDGIWPWAVHRENLRSFEGLVNKGLIEPITLSQGADEVKTYRLIEAGERSG